MGDEPATRTDSLVGKGAIQLVSLELEQVDFTVSEAELPGDIQRASQRFAD